MYVSESSTYTLSLIDTEIDRIVSHVEVGKIPQGLAITQSGNLLIAGILGTDSIVYVDTKQNDVTVKFLLGKVTNVVLSSDNKIIYAGLSSPEQFAIAVIAVNTHTVLQMIPLQSAPKNLALTPDGQFLYFTSEEGPIHILNTKTNSLLPQTISVPSPSHGIAVTHDGQWGLTTSLNERTVSLFDTKSNTVQYTIPVGKQSYGIAISKDNRFAYVSNET